MTPEKTSPDYKETLNLPRTAFPMKANLPAREPEILALWDRIGLYGKIRSARRGAPRFVLHDGPPYANGHVHLGTALNKILKDMVVRFQTLDGRDAPFVPGWDCHGMPIEHQVVRALDSGGPRTSKAGVRHLCREFADRFFRIQRTEFRRLGVLGDWERPYLTMDYGYEADILGALRAMVEGGYIYKGLRPIHWCPTCRTALAEAEVEYHDHSSPSIWVRFPLVREGEAADRAGLGPGAFGGRPVSLVIWTTTPWTIPANLAVCLHPDFDYSFLDAGEEVLVVARPLVERFLSSVKVQASEIAVRKGHELERLECRHPLFDRASLVILGEHVTLDAGTGCVHTAPGHGYEDFLVGQRYGLPTLTPVDAAGVFTEEAGARFAGRPVLESNDAVVEDLVAHGALLLSETVEHAYPHCWRCKNPLIFRATEQWFMNSDHADLRRRALAEIERAQWIPRWGRDRIHNMVAGRPDWCLSRQRTWGVPIPAVICRPCRTAHLIPEWMAFLEERIRREGSDVWFERPLEELLPPDARCPSCGGTDFAREEDILDVWFDASTSHLAVCDRREDLAWPADLYLEATDQHRGWFQYSLLNGIAVKGGAPFRAVLTHGLILDENEKKMSKSLGNVIAPEEVLASHGADVLRLLFASVDYTADIAFSKEMLEPTAERYRKVRNTFRFLLGNLSDFDPARDSLPEAQIRGIDRYALLTLSDTAAAILRDYREYAFHRAEHRIVDYCTTGLSAFYLDILKDRLYTAPPGSPARRAAQTVLFRIATTLVQLCAPILCYTAEEVWQALPSWEGKEESVHLCLAPDPATLGTGAGDPAEIRARWERLLEARARVLKALEEARVRREIGNSLEAFVEIVDEGTALEALRAEEGDLPALFIVSGVAVLEGPPEVRVRRAPGAKCARCWNWSEKTGADPRFPATCERCAPVLAARAERAG